LTVNSINARTANERFCVRRGICAAESFVGTWKFIARMNICEPPPNAKPPPRCMQGGESVVEKALLFENWMTSSDYCLILTDFYAISVDFYTISSDFLFNIDWFFTRFRVIFTRFSSDFCSISSDFSLNFDWFFTRFRVIFTQFRAIFARFLAIFAQLWLIFHTISSDFYAISSDFYTATIDFYAIYGDYCLISSDFCTVSNKFYSRKYIKDNTFAECPSCNERFCVRRGICAAESFVGN
jgi:hypothetical protein